VTRDRCHDFLNIFAEKFGKKLAFLTENKKFIVTLVFEKNANFVAENCQKLQKIVIITSASDWANFRPMGDCLTLSNVLKLPEIHSPHFGLLFP
jgi:hypothetical protein